MDIPRLLDLKILLRSKSLFLLGPRQTGKSFLIRETLRDAKVYNLLHSDVFRKLTHNPSIIRQEWTEKDSIIAIDEIQKLPEILDEVQALIEEKKVRFLLTGSSARKLKRYGTNLLGGRARMVSVHPFVRKELGTHFDLNKAINIGTIPGIYFSDEPEIDLGSYLDTYIQQEVAQEGLTRNLPAFSRFLEVSALCNAEQINFTSIANDAQVARTTVHEYFQILQDTLIANELPAWRETLKRKPVATPKLYFFDWGVVRKLQKIGVVETGSPIFGKAFETYIHHEIRTYCDLKCIKNLYYWRSQQRDEVDFIINEEIACEVKGKSTLNARDIKSLQRLKEESLLKKYYIIYTGKDVRYLTPDRSIEALPYTLFLDRLYAGELVGN